MDNIHKLKTKENMRALVEAAPEYVVPYAISTQDANFVHVFINKSLTLTSCQTLMAELSEYLDEKPRLLLNFGTMSSLDLPLFEQFNELVKLIEDNLGIVQAVSNNEEFIDSVTCINLENTANSLAQVLKYSENEIKFS